MKIETTTPQTAAIQELGGRLARLRKQRGMTQLQLAGEAGLGVATLRRIEDGQDAQLGSWFKLLRAMDLTSAFDSLLPEAALNSPMAEVKSARRRRRPPPGAGKWGDEGV